MGVISDLLGAYSLRRYNRNIQLFLLFGIPFFAGLGLYSLLYNLYLVRLGFREDFVGLISGLMQLASGLVAFPVGLLSDRVGRRPFLLASALMLGIAQVGLCFVHQPGLLLTLAFLAGVSPAFVFVNHIPFLAENSRPENRGHAISFAFGMQVLTRMGVSLVGGSLPALFAWLTATGPDHPSPFRYALLAGAGFSFLSVLPLLGMRPLEPAAPGAALKTDPLPQETERPAGIPFRTLATFASVSAFRGLAFGLSVPFFNLYFDEALSTPATVIGAVFFLGQFVSLPSSMSAPALSRRFGAIPCLVPFRLLGAAGLVVFGGVPGLLWGAAVFLVISAIDSVTTPMEMAFATDLVARAYWGRMQSLRVTGFQILAAVGSIWAGRMILDYGYATTFAAAGLATLGSAVVILAGFGWRPGGVRREG